MNSISDRIIKLFMEKRVLSFSFIVKALQMSSSKVAYHVSELQKREVLEKLGNRYVLTETYRSFLPYFDSLLDRKKYPLVVVKVDITMKGKHLLIFRKKEPFLGFWELPATKLKLGESIEGAAKRVLGKTCTRVKISAPLQLREQVVTNKEVVYDYFLYFVIKDHPFIDGNKRIGSTLFIYFLSKNNFLFKFVIK